MEALKNFFEKRKEITEINVIDLFPDLIVIPSSPNIYKLNKPNNLNSIQLEFKNSGVLVISFLDWRDDPVKTVGVSSITEFNEFHEYFDRYMTRGIRHCPPLYNDGKNNLFQ